MIPSQNEALTDIDDSQFRITLVQQAAASCTGALITSLFVTPLDVVKIRLQTQRKDMFRSKCFLYCNGLMDHICGCATTEIRKQWFGRPGHFNGTIGAFVKISKNEGITSLWSGLGPTLVLAVPATIIYFVAYEQIRLFLKDYINRNRKLSEKCVQPFWVPLVSGATARTFAVSLVSPLELVRTKMQSTRLSYLEIGDALKFLVKQDGIRGLWKGVYATLLRDVPFSALYWSQYETFKRFYGPGVPSFSFSFIAGGISGGVASILTLPFDVVKTHQQIELGEKFYGGNTKTKTAMEILKKLLEEQGVKSLFTGLVPRLIKVAPACAIMIATFEHGKIAFNRLANSYSVEVTDTSTDRYPTTEGSSVGLIRDINITTKQSDVL